MAQTPKQLANLRPPWKKGERGNPHYAGRAKGSRNKINQDYIDAFCREFEKHGEAVFAEVRKKMPHVWLKLAAELLPKQVQVEHGLAEMTDEQLERRIAELNAAIANEIGAAPRAGGPDGGTPPTNTRH
jgi:hypothetical protein